MLPCCKSAPKLDANFFPKIQNHPPIPSVYIKVHGLFVLYNHILTFV